MLGRRQIREKVLECMYAHFQNSVKYEVLENKMLSEMDKLFNLYVFQLNFLVALKELAELQIEIGKQKFIKNEGNTNPNKKFIENKALIQLEKNQSRISFSDKHKELRWEMHNDLLVKTFQRIIQGKRYEDYMSIKETSFDDDQKFLGKLYLRYVAENDSFHELFEEKEISWTDGFHIANSMVQKTIGFMKENEDCHSLIKTIKNKEDEDFAKKLLWEAVRNIEDNTKKIEERLENWDIERISLLDKSILCQAISELDAFPSTASRIIINEYVEISKIYANEKSNIFINGILDKYSKEINRLN